MFRNVSITAVANGWSVRVGCQTFVYETRGGLMRDLGDYLSDPEGTEKRMLASAQNIKHTMDGLMGRAADVERAYAREGAEVLSGTSAGRYDDPCATTGGPYPCNSTGPRL